MLSKDDYMLDCKKPNLTDSAIMLTEKSVTIFFIFHLKAINSASNLTSISIQTL